MSTNLFTQVPYLRTSRNFPQEAQPLSVEINKSYVDIANFVNARTIGIFSANVPSIIGDQWYLTGSQTKQQVLRQVYPFTAAGNIPHGITTSFISGFTRIYGTYTDGTNWYPLPLVDTVNVTNQVSVMVTPTTTLVPGNIVITSGATAPMIVSGYCVLEWLSQT